MKRVIILFTFLTTYLFSEVSFSGYADINLMGNFREENYEAIINPANMAGIRDISIIPNFKMSIDGYDELTNFQIMTSLKSYKIGSLALALAGMENASIIEPLLTQFGEDIISLDIERLFIDFLIGDNLYLSLGRKPYYTGYGYGWNPIDNVNPLKDPNNPGADLKGVDSLSGELSLDSLTLRTLLIVDKSGSDYNSLRVAGDLNIPVNNLDLTLTGHYNFDKNRSSRVNSVGLGLKYDLLGLGIYFEGVILDGSRNLLPETLKYRDELTYNFLTGIEFLFPTDTGFVLEYFYNGEGYNKEERLNYKNHIENSVKYGFPDILHRNSNYTNHYLLLNISQPIYDLFSTINLTSVYSIDSQNLMISPEYLFEISSNMNLKIGFIGLFDFSTDDFTETDMAPVKKAVTLNLSYSL